MLILLQKIIASSGYCSRRQAEVLLKQGLVRVNGGVAQAGDKADPEQDLITVKGKKINQAQKKVYIKFNKPINYTCTTRKFPGEKNIFSLIKTPYQLFTIGRLDKNSRGLIILTNDGELAQRLSHPKYKHEKTYQVSPRDIVNHPKVFIKKFKTGIDIGSGDGVVSVKRISYNRDNNTFLITLTEGKKRQIRRMFRKVNLDIKDLQRIKSGELEIGGLKEGQWAYLNQKELEKLKNNL